MHAEFLAHNKHSINVNLLLFYYKDQVCGCTGNLTLASTDWQGRLKIKTNKKTYKLMMLQIRDPNK